MAESRMDMIAKDLQAHLQMAHLDVNNVSSIVQKGNEELVEKFLSESVFQQVDGTNKLIDNKVEVLQSQLYIACFWGFKEILRGILKLANDQAIPIDVNAKNPDTFWTPLHAATFQEHGPLVMSLLENGADPNMKDSDGRTPVDFASASDKVWGHFAVKGFKKTPRAQLVNMGIIKKVDSIVQMTSPKGNASPREPGKGIRMAASDRPESAYAYNSDPFMQAAATGDVLAADSEILLTKTPMFTAFK